MYREVIKCLGLFPGIDVAIGEYIVSRNRRDFLRHIVNPLLAKYSKERRSLVNVVDEVRKLIALAEDKYGFSSFGGNPGNLAKYIESRDFELVVSALKSADSLDLIIKILETVIDKYSDLPRVVEAAKKKLEQLKQGGKQDTEYRRHILPNTLISEITRHGDVRITETTNQVIIEYDKTRIIISREDNVYKVDVKKTFMVSDIDKLSNIIKTLLKSDKDLE